MKEHQIKFLEGIKKPEIDEDRDQKIKHEVGDIAKAGYNVGFDEGLEMGRYNLAQELLKMSTAPEVTGVYLLEVVTTIMSCGREQARLLIHSGNVKVNGIIQTLALVNVCDGDIIQVGESNFRRVVG